MSYIAAAILGAIFGIAELFSRYRDEPKRAFQSPPGLLYVAINSAVSAGALLIATVFDWRFGVTGELDGTVPNKLTVIRVIVSGLGAMALLRSSVFNLRVANHDIGIGFNPIVQAFLRAADSAVDRGRGVQRDFAVRLMDQVAFEKASAPLPAYCLALMQNVSKEDQIALGREVEGIVKMKADPVIKSRLLGLAIMNIMGEQVLITAVGSLGERIKNPAPRANLPPDLESEIARRPFPE
jgi:hypothetical protein